MAKLRNIPITGRGIIEWTPGQWWVVEVTGPDGSLTPVSGPFSSNRRRTGRQQATDRLDLGVRIGNGGPSCGHSACSQTYIDTGNAQCLKVRQEER